MEICDDPSVAVFPSVDWLTLTALDTDTKENLWALSRGYDAQAQVLGELRRPWGSHGYRGWSADHFAYGERADGALVRIGSWKADAGWQNALQLAGRCTRIDLACNVLLPAADRSIAREAYAAVVGSHRGPGRKTSARLIEASDLGSTATIGSRQSVHFARLYDKGVESKSRPAGLLWRYEVEFKEEAATAMSVALQRQPEPKEWILSTVATWFACRGVRIPWAEQGASMHHAEREPSSGDRALDWIRLSVKPLVHRLIDTLGEDRVLAALAIPSRVSAISVAAA